jgi:DNA-binding response OmpR family regulator
MSGKPHILLIEDDLSLCSALVSSLRSYRFTVFNDLPEGLLLQDESFAAFIIDETLPSGSGSVFLEKHLFPKKTTPVVFITAQATKQLLIKCLNMGVTRFLEKPFHLAQLKTVLDDVLAVQNLALQLDHDLILRPDQKQILDGSKALSLTPIEYKIVEVLATNSGKCFSKKDLLLAIWKENNLAENTIDTHLSNLKKKHLVFRHRIRNVRARGYYWESH